MAAGGYFGQALVVDATMETSEVLPLPDETLRAYIGGSGLGAWLLHQLGTPRAGAGRLGAAGVRVLSAGGHAADHQREVRRGGESPLTGMLTDALASSQFAIAGKLTGHDAIVIRGRAHKPSALLVDGDGARLIDATHLGGMTAADADAKLRGELGRGWRVAAIGPAGERGVRYATISHDGRHAAGAALARSWARRT